MVSVVGSNNHLYRYEVPSENLVDLVQGGKIGALRLIDPARLNNYLSSKGYTLLHIAAMYGHVDIVRMLLEAGLDHAAKTNDGFTPLLLAARFNRCDVIRLFINDRVECLGVCWGEKQLNPLLTAIYYEKLEVAKVFIDEAQSLMEKGDINGDTALHYAAAQGATELVAVLLEAHVDPNSKNAKRATPLHLAAKGGHLEVLSLLVKGGAGLEEQADDIVGYAGERVPSIQFTPLHVAALFNRAQAIQLLLEYGANIEAANHRGWTAIYIACYMGYAEAFATLLDNKASTHIKDPATEGSVLVIAAQHGKNEIIRIIKQRMPERIFEKTTQGRTALHAAVAAGQIEVFDNLTELLEEGTINEAWTPLHLAAYYDKAQSAQVLIGLGANISCRDALGRTPLYVAALSGNHKVFRVLLQQGAEISVQAIDGSTLAHAACRGANLQIISELWLKDSSLFEASGDLLAIALRDGNYRIVEFLYKRGMTIHPPEGPFDTSTTEGQRDALTYERWHDFQESKKWQIDTAHFSWKVRLPDEEWPSLAAQWKDVCATLMVEKEGIEEEDHLWYGLNRLVDYTVNKKHGGIPAIPAAEEEKKRFFRRIERFLQHIFGMKRDLPDDFYSYCMRLNGVGRACGEGWVHGVRMVWIEVVRDKGLLDVPFAQEVEDALGETAGKLVIKEAVAFSFVAEDVRQKLFDRLAKECNPDIFSDAHRYGEYMRAFGDIFKLFGYEHPLPDDTVAQRRGLEAEENRDKVKSWFAAKYTPCVLLWAAREHILLKNRDSDTTGWEEWNKGQREEWRSKDFRGVLNSAGLAAFLRFLKVLTPNQSTCTIL